jgi:Adenylate and Guanylate cyclase catalytic domain
MAVFGIPLAHEDDALEGRIGVTTGEVVTGTEERLASGDAVNVAARLQDAAEPGEVLVGEATLVHVREAVEVEALAPLELKGEDSAGRGLPAAGGTRDAASARDPLCRPSAGVGCDSGGVGARARGAELRPDHDRRQGQGRQVSACRRNTQRLIVSGRWQCSLASRPLGRATRRGTGRRSHHDLAAKPRDPGYESYARPGSAHALPLVSDEYVVFILAGR